mgnify:CR=1 FL=1
MDEQRKKGNLRLALVLASVVIALFIGFIVKSAIYGI